MKTKLTDEQIAVLTEWVAHEPRFDGARVHVHPDDLGALLAEVRASRAPSVLGEGTDAPQETNVSDYDRSIHSNPDAAAWARFFEETRQKNGWPSIPDEATMIGWFANAMMAMNDHLRDKVVEAARALIAAEDHYDEVLHVEGVVFSEADKVTRALDALRASVDAIPIPSPAPDGIEGAVVERIMELAHRYAVAVGRGMLDGSGPADAARFYLRAAVEAVVRWERDPDAKDPGPTPGAGRR